MAYLFAQQGNSRQIPRYIKREDVDGSGTSDIFYFGNHQIKIWRNQSGNSLRELSQDEPPRFLPVDSATNVAVVDLMGGFGLVKEAPARRRIGVGDEIPAFSPSLFSGG